MCTDLAISSSSSCRTSKKRDPIELGMEKIHSYFTLHGTIFCSFCLLFSSFSSLLSQHDEDVCVLMMHTHQPVHTSSALSFRTVILFRQTANCNVSVVSGISLFSPLIIVPLFVHRDSHDEAPTRACDASSMHLHIVSGEGKNTGRSCDGVSHSVNWRR